MMEKDRKLEWKIGSVIIIIFFGFMIYGIVTFFYRGSPAEILSVTDQFKPEKDWVLVSEHVEPPGNFCIDIDCPSVGRTWTIPSPVSEEEAYRRLSQAGWTIDYSEGCYPYPDMRSEEHTS